MIKNCLVCNKIINPRPAKVRMGRGNYCKIHAGFALKNKPSWNKGLKGVIKPNSGSFKKGEHRSPQTEFKKGQGIGKANHNWKDEGFSKEALHMWIARQLGKPIRCQFCLQNKNLQWANKSQLYKRDLEDWLELCSKCHKYYDNYWHKMMGIKSFRRRRFING